MLPRGIGPRADHAVTSMFLHYRSGPARGGDAEALGIAARIAFVLDGTNPTVSGHRVVLLRVTAHEVGRPTKDGLRRALVRFQALTEVIV